MKCVNCHIFKHIIDHRGPKGCFELFITFRHDQNNLIMDNALKMFADIEGFVFDVDGVFTDGGMLVTEEGEMLRKMNTRDGYAIKLLLKAGLKACIITGGDSEGVRSRFEKLGVEDVFIGIKDKLNVLNMWLDRSGQDPEKLGYMGDDLPDLRAMQAVGLKCCPSDADPQVKSLCDYVSPFGGGKGCVRDVIEKCLRSKKQWPLF